MGVLPQGSWAYLSFWISPLGGDTPGTFPEHLPCAVYIITDDSGKLLLLCPLQR